MEKWFTARVKTLETLNAVSEDAGIGEFEFNKNIVEEDAFIYNLQGQKVDKYYKGIVIKQLSSGKRIKIKQ